MYELKVKTHFDAAHQLMDYKGKCNRLHGHRWDVEVVLCGKLLDRRNMLVDFADVKNGLKELIDGNLDHFCLNETLKEPNPTAEYLAHWLYDRIPLTVGTGRLVSVEVWESPECSVKYFEGGVQ